MRKRNRKIMIFLCVAIVLILLLAAVAARMASFVMTGKRQTLEEAFAWQSDHYDTSFYKGLKKTGYVVQGLDGYELHAEFLENPEPTTKYVILSHGYTDNRLGSLKYVPMYLKLGFHCVLYDLRGHGENRADFTTYGIREAEDLKRLIEDARKRFPDMTVLGLHGESLGAATTITVLKFRPQVDFAVADCGFSDIENVLRQGYRSARAPQFLFGLSDLGARLRYRYSLKDMRPIDSLDGNTVPVLFIHGAEDGFILPKNSQDMAARTKGYSEVRLIPKAGHAQSILTAPEEYLGYVKAFLKTCGLE